MTESIPTPNAPKNIDRPAPRTTSLRVARPFTLFLTGLPGAGKTTIARAVESRLAQWENSVLVLDGDEVRRTISADLGFSREDRIENLRRVSRVAAECDADVSIIATVSPSNAARELARKRIEGRREFVLVWVATPQPVCEDRDPKGMYAAARAGEIPNFTGVDGPYEPPENADLLMDTSNYSIDHTVDVIAEMLRDRGLLGNRQKITGCG